MYLSDLFVAAGTPPWLCENPDAVPDQNFGEQAMHRLTLETAHTNLAGQALYESLGYEKDKVFIAYHKML